MNRPESTELDDSGVYDQLARLGKALSNPVRLRLLDLLEQGEHTVEELARAAEQPVKNTSAQLQQLRAAQLVETRREGVRIHYRLAGRKVSKFLGDFQGFAEETLAEMKVELDELSRKPGGLQRISIKEFRQRLRDQQTVIIDVRPAEEYARGHIPGAVSIPLSELRQRMDELPDDHDVIAYCEGPYCFASGKAVDQLERAGYPVRRLDGGLARWVRSGGRLQSAG